jgi:hypothetical protein
MESACPWRLWTLDDGALISDQVLVIRMMDEEYTIEDWKDFERRVLDDPKKSSEWADRVIDAWIRRKSGKSRRPSTSSKSSS